jgi:hypothetical protein
MSLAHRTAEAIAAEAGAIDARVLRGAVEEQPV